MVQDNLGFNDDIGFSLGLVVSTIIFCLLLKKEGKEPIKFLKIHKVKFNIIMAILMISITSIFFNLGVSKLFEKIIKPNTSDDIQLYWGSIIHLVFLAPICEEILFRGIIFTKLKNVMPLFLAIIIQGIIFGCFHGSLSTHIPQTFSGIIYGLIYYYTNNLTISILFHSFNNLLLVILDLLFFTLNINWYIYIPMSVLYLLMVIKFIKHNKSCEALDYNFENK